MCEICEVCMRYDLYLMSENCEVLCINGHSTL